MKLEFIEQFINYKLQDCNFSGEYFREMENFVNKQNAFLNALTEEQKSQFIKLDLEEAKLKCIEQKEIISYIINLLVEK